VTRSKDPFVIVGGGPAAASAARCLAQAGRRVVLLTAETRPPYDRTQLSKQVLAADGGDPAPLWDSTQEWYHHVDMRTGCLVERLDVAGRRAVTADGTSIGYEGLLLATGASPRRLRLPGEDGPGVHHLRDLTDAHALAADLGRARRIAVIGGGLIGLEVAAVAAARGVEVHVLEAAARLLTRGVPEPVAATVAGWHAAAGVQVTTGVFPTGIQHGPDGTPVGVRLLDGAMAPADAVVVGVGVAPRDDLAADAGLTVDDGIVVDTSCRTSADGVWAAGDAVRMLRDVATGHPPGRGIRLESFTDAQRQGEVAASAMLGHATIGTPAPFSWSDQLGRTISCIGGAPSDADIITVATPDAVVVLTVTGTTLRAVCAAGTAGATGRLVATARHLVTRQARVDVTALTAAHDVAALSRSLLATLRALEPVEPRTFLTH
jgi:NADPH-dependent 2,4-dienoyl-CoA reductase/sulfur reductase-like enzyme